MPATAPEALIHWLETESPTRHADGVNRMMDLVVRELDGWPVTIERINGRDGLGDHLIARAGPRTDAKGVLIASHLDTVHPLGTKDRDLPIRIEGERLYGPGVYDMKGGAYLGLQAFKDAVATGDLVRPVAYLFTSDEEIGSPTSRPIIESEARKAGAALITEPARDGGKIVTGRKGVGRFFVSVEGRPAHSGARHELGRSAIREAARQILRIENMTDYPRGVTLTVGVVQGGSADNVVPQHCRFSVDLRVCSHDDGTVLEQALLNLTSHDPDVRVQVTGGMNRPPMERSAATLALFEHARAVAAGIGIDLQDVALTGGGSDGNFTAALGVPTLDGLGIDGDGAHTLQEYGLIGSIEPRRALLRDLILAQARSG